MKYIDELLKGHEVEWKKLGEVCEIKTGKGVTKKEAKPDGLYPIISGGKSPMDFIDTYNRQANTVTVSRVGANAGFVNYIKECFYLNDKCFSVIPKSNFSILSSFLYYALKVQEGHLSALQSGGGVPTINTTKLGSILIPLPPLPVQEEIVRILDKFTALEAELEAELDCRKRQYEYYRNQLLSFDMLNRGGQRLNNVNWMTVEKISKNISSGGTPRSNITTYYGGDIPWLRTQEVNFSDIWDTDVKITKEGMDASSAKYIPANCVIIAMYGATVGRVGINKIPLTTNQACANIEVNENIALYRYVFYYLSSQYEYIKSLGAGSQTNINSRIVKELRIPIPPLSEQHRIVSILDKFDTLVNSISEGLPKEIELRRKQYEYYREQLLSFRH